MGRGQRGIARAVAANTRNGEFGSAGLREESVTLIMVEKRDLECYFVEVRGDLLLLFVCLVVRVRLVRVELKPLRCLLLL